MTTPLLGGRLVLAAVFTIAGMPKLANREGSRRAVMDFGVPTTLSGAVVLLLPSAELTVAAALIPTFTAQGVL